jgi:hypothetical protein
MDNLPEDILYIILKNFSVKEEVFMRRVNTIFKFLINTSSFKVNRYKLETSLRRINRIELKMREDKIWEYISLSGIKFYKEEKVHYYFRISEKYDVCVALCCEKRMGDVYHSKRSKNEYNSEYNKRYIPYCINCFSKFK